jgi:hypothetical protein
VGATVLVATAVVAFTYEPVDSCETPVEGAALEVMVIWKGDELKAFCDVADRHPLTHPSPTTALDAQGRCPLVVDPVRGAGGVGSRPGSEVSADVQRCGAGRA